MDTEVRSVLKQVRAERTRQALIAAAATEFDRHGYAGTPLSAVHRACGMTMGAFTIHFRSKADLATAVCQEAENITREALAQLAPIVEFTLVVARLLEEKATVRAAARLAQERAVPSQWHTVWRAVLNDLMAAARDVAPAEKLIRPGGGWCTGGVERGRLGGCSGHLVSAPAG